MRTSRRLELEKKQRRQMDRYLDKRRAPEGKQSRHPNAASSHWETSTEQQRACEVVAQCLVTRTAGARIDCQRPSRFWGLGCPKIYHEVEDTLVCRHAKPSMSRPRHNARNVGQERLGTGVERIRNTQVLSVSSIVTNSASPI